METVRHLLVTIVGLTMLVGASIAEAATKRPHIVFITADDMGWNDVSFHGSNQVSTPNLDALAYDGIILNRHYSAPMCTPSRAALMTGKNPINIGMQHYVIDNDQPWGLGLDQRILPEYFREAGYRTHLVGKWHLGFFAKQYTPTMRGFDSHVGYLGPYIDYWNYVGKMTSNNYAGYDMRHNLSVNYDANGTYATDYLTAAATKVIENHNLDESLLLVVNHLAPHTGNDDDPLQAPDETIEKFAYIDDKSRRTYAAMVSKLDDSVGAIFRSLQLRSMLNNTIIVFLADNGGVSVGQHANTGSNFPLRGQKNAPWEGAVRTAAFIWSPLLMSKQRVSNQWFHISDWLPTLASVAGIELATISDTIDGVDQWEALSYDTGNPRNAIMNMLDEIFGYTSYMENGIKYVNGTTRDGAYDEWYGQPDVQDVLPTNGDYARMVLATDIAKQTIPMLDEHIIANLRGHATVSCGNAVRTTQCNPLKRPCLFDIIHDPCELHDISLEHADKLRSISARVEKYRRLAVKPRNKPHDPDADPAKHGGIWTWWRTDPGWYPVETRQHEENSHPNPMSDDVQLSVVIPVTVVGVLFVCGALLYLANKNPLRLCCRKKGSNFSSPANEESIEPSGKSDVPEDFSSKIFVISGRDTDR